MHLQPSLILRASLNDNEQDGGTSPLQGDYTVPSSPKEVTSNGSLPLTEQVAPGSRPLKTALTHVHYWIHHLSAPNPADTWKFYGRQGCEGVDKVCKELGATCDCQSFSPSSDYKLFVLVRMDVRSCGEPPSFRAFASRYQKGHCDRFRLTWKFSPSCHSYRSKG